MACAVNFKVKSVVFVTGASRGIGRAIAVESAKLVADNSIFVLIARGKDGLNATKQLVNEINDTISLLVCVLDLSVAKEDAYEAIFEETIAKLDNKTFPLGVFFHNAGQMGVLTKTVNLDELKVWRNYFEMNYFSSAVMNSLFVRSMRAHVSKLAVVNVTSLLGRVPMADMVMYGSVKAAKEMYFKVLAAEEKDVVVLNYSPGPVETDMFDGVIKNAGDADVKREFAKIRAEKKVLTTEQTVTVMLNVLQSGEFASGDTIDYYDKVER